MPSHKKNKQRRHIRYAINLPALLVVDAHSQYQCHILDFCSHGLFLKLSQADVDIPIANAVKIEFSIGPAHSQEQYLINAQVMHLAHGGVGVLIDNMPLAVFEVLKTQTPPGVTLSVPADVEESSRIALFNENFRHCLLESLPGIIQAFYEMLPEEAKAINQQRVCFENNSQLDDLITSLKIEMDSVTCEFCHSIADQLQFITETNVKNEDLSDFDRTLSLVEKEDFEDWLHKYYATVSGSWYCKWVLIIKSMICCILASGRRYILICLIFINGLNNFCSLRHQLKSQVSQFPHRPANPQICHLINPDIMGLKTILSRLKPSF
jgi:hypothetical protein